MHCIVAIGPSIPGQVEHVLLIQAATRVRAECTCIILCGEDCEYMAISRQANIFRSLLHDLWVFMAARHIIE
jgi:hypothetical protein